MTPSKSLLLFLCCSFVLGCSSRNISTQTDTSEALPNLYHYEVNNGFITITAPSKGCTFLNSFIVKVDNISTNSLKIVRAKPDNCSMAKREVRLQYSFKHLGLDRSKMVTVQNKTISRDS